MRSAAFLRQRPAADEIGVAVEAAAVNPIDVKRSKGYGRRLLSLRRAAKFPLVLGNDFAGTVTAAGAAVSAFKLAMRFGASGRHAMYGKF